MKLLTQLLILIPTTAITTAAVFTTNTSDPVNREYDAIGLERLSIENGMGRTTIQSGDRAKVLITVSKRRFTERCSVFTERTRLSEIVIRVEKPVDEICEADIEVTLPKKVDLNIVSGSGTVNIKGIEGKLALVNGSGAISATGIFPAVALKSGNGTVDIAGMTGGGDISIGSGPVALRFLDNPKGNVDIKSGAGNTVLYVPKSSKIKASLNTGSGDLSNDLTNYDSAEFGINVKTGTGDVQVKAY